MIFTELKLPGVFRMDLNKKIDHRGFFARAYCRNEYQQQGLETEWVQMNHTLTQKKGALRGLHFQRNPETEAKVVRCIKGAIFDVVLDLRKGSPTYGKWICEELSDFNRSMLYIPRGCAHGFQTLQVQTELFYMHSNFYSPESEGGVLYNDTQLNIPWPLPVKEISERDKNHPKLKEIKPIEI